MLLGEVGPTPANPFPNFDARRVIYYLNGAIPALRRDREKMDARQVFLVLLVAGIANLGTGPAFLMAETVRTAKPGARRVRKVKPAPAAAKPQPPAEGPVTLVGEVLDLACFLSRGDRGKAHKKCARVCVLGGTPMGLLADNGDVYLLLDNHEKQAPYEAAKKLAAERVKVTGQLVIRGGLRGVVVETAVKTEDNDGL